MKRLAGEFKNQLWLLKKRDRVLLAITAAFMLILSLIDAGALSLLSNTVKGSSSQSLMKHAPVLALIVFLFILKSLLSALITYGSMRHFEKIEYLVGAKNVERFRVSKWSEVRELTAVDLSNYFEKSPNAIATSLLFSGALFMSEAITAAAITIVLLKEALFSSLVALVFFAFVVLIQNRFLGRLSEKVGSELIQNNNEVQLRIQEIARLGKLLKITNGLGLYGKLNSHRKDMIRSRNTAWYLGSVPRYYMEAVLAAGLVIVAGASLVESGPDAIFPALSLFAAAGYRLLPTINRMQSYALTALSAFPYIKVEDEILPALKSVTDSRAEFMEKKDGTLIELRDVSFRFPDSEIDVLNAISLRFMKGKTYALIGPSGSGKTTLADLCLGLLEPTGGHLIFRSGITLAYVPQETSLLNGSMAENVALGEKLQRKSFEDAIKGADLVDLTSRFAIDNLPQLSGGQKQRIGLARALYQNAEFTVFDEATSALDNLTEQRVVENLRKMKPASSTLLIIAHRLSTVRDVDQLIFLDNGTVIGVGTWQYLMETSEAFRNLVKLGELDKA